MSFQRLVLLAGLFMTLTAVVVYSVTKPASALPTSEQPTTPPSETVSTIAASSNPRTARQRSLARPDPPTTQEWLSATVVHVTGLPEPTCTARKLGEWLRVACEGVDRTGGAPRDARLLNAKSIQKEVGSTGIVHVAWKTTQGTAYTAAGNSILSLVCPFVEGIELRAQFEWTDSKAILLINWSPGLAEPNVKGTFVAVAL